MLVEIQHLLKTEMCNFGRLTSLAVSYHDFYCVST